MPAVVAVSVATGSHLPGGTTRCNPPVLCRPETEITYDLAFGFRHYAAQGDNG
jgi:hypothetical protein